MPGFSEEKVSVTAIAMSKTPVKCGQRGSGKTRSIILICQYSSPALRGSSSGKTGKSHTHKGGLMVSSLSSATQNISNFYYQNNIAMGKSMMRLSTGNKFTSPSDDIGGYMHAQNLTIQSNGYDDIMSSLAEWKGAMGVASSTATEVSNSLQRMNELINLSQQSTDNNSKDAYQSEFTQLYTKVNQLVTNTSYNGQNMLNSVATLGTVYLDPSYSAGSAFAIQFAAQAIVPANLTALKTTSNGGTLLLDHTAVAADYTAARTAVQTALTNANTYISTAGSFSSTLDSYYNVCSAAKTNLAGAISAVSDTNDAEELATYTSASIQSQAAMAMLAQANLSNRSVLALFNGM